MPMWVEAVELGGISETHECDESDRKYIKVREVCNFEGLAFNSSYASRYCTVEKSVQQLV